MNSPKGIRDHLLHSVPPWDHSDADDADLRATYEALSRGESILPSEPSFRAPLRPSPSNEEYKEYHGEDDPGTRSYSNSEGYFLPSSDVLLERFRLHTVNSLFLLFQECACDAQHNHSKTESCVVNHDA